MKVSISPEIRIRIYLLMVIHQNRIKKVIHQKGIRINRVLSLFFISIPLKWAFFCCHYHLCLTINYCAFYFRFEIFWPMHDMWKSYMKQRLCHVGLDFYFLLHQCFACISDSYLCHWVIRVSNLAGQIH